MSSSDLSPDSNVRFYDVFMALSPPLYCISFLRLERFPQAADAGPEGRITHTRWWRGLWSCRCIAAQGSCALEGRAWVGQEKVNGLWQVTVITQLCLSFRGLPDNADLKTEAVRVCVCDLGLLYSRRPVGLKPRRTVCVRRFSPLLSLDNWHK